MELLCVETLKGTSTLLTANLRYPLTPCTFCALSLLTLFTLLCSVFLSLSLSLLIPCFQCKIIRRFPTWKQPLSSCCLSSVSSLAPLSLSLQIHTLKENNNTKHTETASHVALLCERILVSNNQLRLRHFEPLLVQSQRRVNCDSGICLFLWGKKTILLSHQPSRFGTSIGSMKMGSLNCWRLFECRRCTNNIFHFLFVLLSMCPQLLVFFVFFCFFFVCVCVCVSLGRFGGRMYLLLWGGLFYRNLCLV